MPTALGARPSNAPLPVGTTLARRATSEAGTATWPATDNYLIMSGGSGNTGVFRKTERFWLKAGASLICCPVTAAQWVAYVYALRLVVNGAYGNDLNGNGTFTRYNSVDGPAGGNNWWGTSIEALFYCEANTNYDVYLLSRYAGGNTYYYQSNGHMNLWAYTIGEGVY